MTTAIRPRTDHLPFYISLRLTRHSHECHDRLSRLGRVPDRDPDLRLHALPEHMGHGTQKVQDEIVAVLALISLFTHNHLYWIIGLLLALVQIPDFSTPLARMANSLAKMAGAKRTPRTAE